MWSNSSKLSVKNLPSWAGYFATTPSQSNDQESLGLDRIRARKACPVIDTSAGAGHFRPAGSEAEVLSRIPPSVLQ